MNETAHIVINQNYIPAWNMSCYCLSIKVDQDYCAGDGGYNYWIVNISILCAVSTNAETAFVYIFLLDLGLKSSGKAIG